MREVSTNNFGLLIAYIVPGFTALWGASYFSPTLRVWLGNPPADGPTLGGFLYVTAGSIVAGLTVSTIRWVLVDTIHHHTGIQQPQWDFARLQSSVTAFDTLIQIHYRYYQFYGGMLVALSFAYLSRRMALGFLAGGFNWNEVTFFLLITMFYAASRDTLRKYYCRVEGLLGTQK